MSRRLTLLLIVGGSVVVLGGGFLWALPEIVRRTVVTQFPKLTGRAVSLEDIDLNLFTGRLVLTKLRIAERDPSETFIQAERIALRLVPFSLITGHLVLAEVAFTAPRIRIVRTGPDEFNFSDLLTLLPPADPNEPKGDWTLSITRLALVDGALLVADRAVSPARDWRIQGITVEAGGLTTRAARPPGHLAVRDARERGQGDGHVRGPRRLPDRRPRRDGSHGERRAGRVALHHSSHVRGQLDHAGWRPQRGQGQGPARSARRADRDLHARCADRAIPGLFPVSGALCRLLQRRQPERDPAPQGWHAGPGVEREAWARDFEVRAPGADTPVARLARMEIQGIDFSWPNYALIKRVVLTKPEAQVERDADGIINLQRLFASERTPRLRRRHRRRYPRPRRPAAPPRQAKAGVCRRSSSTSTRSRRWTVCALPRPHHHAGLFHRPQRVHPDHPRRRRTRWAGSRST